MDTRTLHDELRARGMGHVADELELAAAHPDIRNEALETAPAPEPTAAPEAGGGLSAVPAPAPAGEPVPAWANDIVSTVNDFGRFMEMVNRELEAERAALPQPQPAAPVAPTGPALPEINMYDPDSIARYVQAVQETSSSSAQEIAQRLFEERIGPYQPILDQIAAREGEQLARAHLDALATGDPQRGIPGLGQFDRDHALLLANSHMANGVPADQAFLAAARMTQAFEQRIRSEGARENEQHLSTAVNAPAEPAPGAAPGTEVRKIDGRDPDRYNRLADEWLNRRRAGTQPTGLIG